MNKKLQLNSKFEFNNNFFSFFILLLLLCATPPVAGSSCFWATSSKCLISESWIRFSFFALTPSASESGSG